MPVPLAEPTVLAAAKDVLYPDVNTTAYQYAVTETQFTQSTWGGWTIPQPIRDRLAPYNTIRLHAGEPDLLGVGMPATDVLNGDAYGQLCAVLMDLGYAEVQSSGPDYWALEGDELRRERR